MPRKAKVVEAPKPPEKDWYVTHIGDMVRLDVYDEDKRSCIILNAFEAKALAVELTKKPFVAKPVPPKKGRK